MIIPSPSRGLGLVGCCVLVLLTVAERPSVAGVWPFSSDSNDAVESGAQTDKTETGTTPSANAAPGGAAAESKTKRKTTQHKPPQRSAAKTKPPKVSPREPQATAMAPPQPMLIQQMVPVAQPLKAAAPPHEPAAVPVPEPPPTPVAATVPKSPPIAEPAKGDVDRSGTIPKDQLPDAANDARKFCVNIAGTATDARFAWQTKMLQELEDRIKTRTAELDAKQAELRNWLAQRDAVAKKAEAKLVDIYSKMRPETAASQISALDDDMAAAVLMHLNARQAGAIFNEIAAERAAKLAGIMTAAPPSNEKKL